MGWSVAGAQDELHSQLRRIDGLDLCLGGPSHTVCIGWDYHAVSRFARNIGKEIPEEIDQEQEDEWEEVMEDQHEFVASVKKKTTKVALTDHKKLHKCKGSYVVRCEELSGGWDNCDSLGIDIAAGPKADILQAVVEFGIIEGTMLLAFNEADQDAHIGTASRYNNSNSDEDEDEDDSEGSENSYLIPTSSSKKRKAPKAALKSGRGRPKKQVKTSKTTSNCLHFRLRGREAGEGSVLYTPEKGCLDFTDSDFVAFKGVASLPSVARKVPFEGYKVNAEAMTQKKPWSAFFERVYEEERVSRWH